MSARLDAVDRAIVSLLVEDGRMSAAAITRRIGRVSERAVRYRVERLIGSGVLRVAAVVDPASVGYPVIGDVLVDVAPGRLQEVAARIVDLENVSYVAGSVGDGDLSVQICAGVAASRQRGHRQGGGCHARTHRDGPVEAEGRVPVGHPAGGSGRLVTCGPRAAGTVLAESDVKPECLDRIGLTMSNRPTNRTDRTRGNAVPFSLDAIDRKIVSLLLEDGRVSSAEITRRIGHVSERAVRYRIERLIRCGVIRVSAIVDPHAVGFVVIGDVLIDVAPGKLQDVAAQIVQFDNVSYVAGSVGEGDLSIQVYARDTEELLRFVNEVVGKVPGVTRTKTAMVPWKLKDVYQWHVPAGAAEEGRSTV